MILSISSPVCFFFLVTWMSPVETCLSGYSAHILIVFIFLLSCMSCSYPLEINPFLVTWFANISFSHSVVCLFNFSGFLCCAKLNYISFVFIYHTLGGICENICCIYEKILAYLKECPAYTSHQEFYSVWTYT